MHVRRLSGRDYGLMLLVFVLALVARGLYTFHLHLNELAAKAAAAPLADVGNRIVDGQFASSVPFGPAGRTAFVEPAYAYVVLQPLFKFFPHVKFQGVFLVQVVLGALTCVLYYLLARRIFLSPFVSALTGVICAVNYFWVVSTGRLSPVTLACFLMGVVLLLAMRMFDSPGFWTALGLGLTMAALTLTQAYALPFLVGALIWLWWRRRYSAAGWAWAFLVLVLFVAGLAPWTYRNWRSSWPHRAGPDGAEVTETETSSWFPIITRLPLEFWWGSNDGATGGRVDAHGQADYVSRFDPVTDKHKLDEMAQLPEPQRYGALAGQAIGWAAHNPGRFFAVRIRALVYFWTSQNLWLPDPEPAPAPATQNASGAGTGAASKAPAATQPQATTTQAAALAGPKIPEHWATGVFLCVLLGSAVVGLRWSYAWRQRVGLLTVALVLLPLPYVLTHAGLWHDPRMPLDGILILYGSFALACLVPGLSYRLRSADVNALVSTPPARPAPPPADPDVSASLWELAGDDDGPDKPIPLG